MLIMVVSGVGYIFELKAEERDPFTSIIDLREQELSLQKKINLSQVDLKGVIWNPERAIAIINDELVMAGDNWQGFKVERIDKDSMILSDNSGSYKLSVEEAPSLNKTDLDKTGLGAITPELPIPESSVSAPPEGIIPYTETERLR